MIIEPSPLRRLEVSSVETTPIGGLKQMFEIFDRYRERIPLDVLASVLERLDLSRDDLSGFSIFDANCYRRNRIYSGPAYEALLICWQPGQRSPIHDHEHSSCAFRILQGECTETVYVPSRAGASVVEPVSHSVESRGFVCATQDADIHEVANLGTTNLQTLHVYSPPLGVMGTYRPLN